MIERLHFHRGYSLRLHKSKPFINYGIISVGPILHVRAMFPVQASYSCPPLPRVHGSPVSEYYERI